MKKPESIRAEAVPDKSDQPFEEFEVAAVQGVLVYELVQAAIIAKRTRDAIALTRAAAAANQVLQNEQNKPNSDKKPEGDNDDGDGNNDPDQEPDDEDNKKKADKIGDGHAYDKHVEKNNEFPEIKDKEEFKKHIEDVMNNSDEVKELERGRKAYWDKETETIVIEDPNNPDGGTAFKARHGKVSFENLK